MFSPRTLRTRPSCGWDAGNEIGTGNDTMKKSLQKIQKTFRGLYYRTLEIPEENLRERKPGSIPCGSGRLTFVFGVSEGREYLEYYLHHRISGDSHGRIFEDGRHESLPELSTMYGCNPDIPGDEERSRREMEKNYREVFEDLKKKGLLDAGPVSLQVNAHLVMKGDGEDP